MPEPAQNQTGGFSQARHSSPGSALGCGRVDWHIVKHAAARYCHLARRSISASPHPRNRSHLGSDCRLDRPKILANGSLPCDCLLHSCNRSLLRNFLLRIPDLELPTFAAKGILCGERFAPLVVPSRLAI